MDKGYEEILRRIKATVQDAASRGDPIALLEILSQEKAISGLVSRLRARWRVIDDEDLSDIICSSIDNLFYYVREGKSSSNPMGYLWKTADFKAHEYYRRTKRKVNLDSIENTLHDKSLGRDFEEGISDDLDEREVKRVEAVRVARLMLPKIKSENYRNVLGYVIDAAEKGVDNLENQEIADAVGLSLRTVRDCLYRGFNRLSELAVKENIVQQPFDFLYLKEETDDELEDKFEQE